jgi:hypothetical protein
MILVGLWLIWRAFQVAPPAQAEPPQPQSA